MKKIKRLIKYLFVKRLAKSPYKPLDGSNCDKMLYEWQKMPAAYRWF